MFVGTILFNTFSTAKTSYEMLESERFNAMIEVGNIGGFETQVQEADASSMDTAQSYDVRFICSLLLLLSFCTSVSINTCTLDFSCTRIKCRINSLKFYCYTINRKRVVDF